jgi:Plant transposon protein
MLSGTFPPFTPKYRINGDDFAWFYYLADGIYPAWKIFVRSLREPKNEKQRSFCRLQEGVRKCVERVFGVFFRRFKVMFVSSELWSVEKMGVIAKACVILHNMIVEVRKDTYSSDGARGLSRTFQDASEITDLEVFRVEDETPFFLFKHMYRTSSNIKNSTENTRLILALISHIWDVKGRLG